MLFKGDGIFQYIYTIVLFSISIYWLISYGVVMLSTLKYKLIQKHYTLFLSQINLNMYNLSWHAEIQ